MACAHETHGAPSMIRDVRGALSQDTADSQKASKQPNVTSNLGDISSRDVGKTMRLFCDSDEGPLPPSESTSLSFISSESICNIGSRVTDLVELRRPQTFAEPSLETGDGRPCTRAASKTYPAIQDSNNTSSHQPRERQQLETQVQREPLDSPLARMGREAVCTEDVSKVLMIGNQHYLCERASTPRSSPAGISIVMDETQCIIHSGLAIPASSSNSNVARRTRVELEAPLSRQSIATQGSLCSPKSPKENCDFNPPHLRELIGPQPAPAVQSTPPTPKRSDSPPLQPVSTPQILTARQRSVRTLAQLKVDVVAGAVHDIQLDHHQSVSQALQLKRPMQKASRASTGDVCAMEDSELVEAISNPLSLPGLSITPSQPAVLSFSYATSTPARNEVSLPAFPNSFQDTCTTVTSDSVDTIGLPSSEDLFAVSESSTTVSNAAVGWLTRNKESAELQSTDSAARTCRQAISTRGRRAKIPSTRVFEEPCFESIYNSILELHRSPASPNTAASSLGNQNDRQLSAEGLHRNRKQSLPDSQGITTDVGMAAMLNSNSTPQLLPTQDVVCPERKPLEPIVPQHSGEYVETRPSSGHQLSTRRQPSTPRLPRDQESPTARNDSELKTELGVGSPPLHKPTRGSEQPISLFDVDSGDTTTCNREDEISSFFSFDESGSESPFLPISTNLDWTEDDGDFN